MIQPRSHVFGREGEPIHLRKLLIIGMKLVYIRYHSLPRLAVF